MNEKRLCLECGKELIRGIVASGKRAGTLEAPANFKKRRFCGYECVSAFKRGKNREEFWGKDGERSRAWLGTLARRHLKQSCEICFTSEKLEIHHIDRNWKNNALSNLMTLCDSCHIKWHHQNDPLVAKKDHPPCRYCGRPYLAKSSRGDLCATHRSRIQRTGSSDIMNKEKLPCKICGEPYKDGSSRGDLCNKHRLQLKRNGAISEKRANAKEAKPCRVCGKTQILIKELCNAHYLKLRRHGDPLYEGKPGPKQ